MKRLLSLCLFLLFALPVVAQQTTIRANITTGGTDCSVATNCAVLSLPTFSSNPQGSADITVTGTFSATLQFEGSTDGVTFSSLTATPLAGGTAVTSATAAGAWQVNTASISVVRVRASAFVSGTAGIFINSFPSNSGTVSSGINTIGTSGPLPLFGGYTFYVNGGTVYARNNRTLTVDFSGTDAAVVINDVLGALVNVGGTLYFKNGMYNFNSATQETVSPYTLFYCVGIPSTNTTSYPQFNFVAESGNIGIEVGIATPTSPTNNGVVFNVTTAAETAAGAGNTLAAFWMRPNITRTGASASIFWNDQIFFNNVALMFPNNQRGNEIGIDMLEASYASLRNVDINFATPPTILSAAGNKAFIGPAAPSDGAYVLNSFNVGFAMGFELNSEHSVIINAQSFHDTTGFGYGIEENRNASQLGHPSEWSHIIPYDCVHAFEIGTNIESGAQLDLLDFDLEYITSGAWAFSNSIVEDTPGLTGGLVTWTDTLTNVGVSGGTLISPFAAGSGTNYTVLNSSNTSQRMWTTPGKDFTIQETGDQYPGSFISVQSRAGIVGAQVGELSLPFADLEVASVGRISTVAVSSNVLTVTFSNTFGGGDGGFPVGSPVFLSGLTTATFLNFQNVTVASSTNTSFTATFSHANYSSASDTGTAILGITARSQSIAASLLNSANNIEYQILTQGNGGSPFVAFGPSVSSFKGAIQPATFTVATLPSASTLKAGAMLIVTDATTFTPGTCAGGGSDTMIAVSNGTTWSCH